MTKAEALREAQRRWGNSSDLGFGGRVFDRAETDQLREEFQASISRVGRYWVGKDFTHYGNGPSWEAAFEDADERQGGKA